MTKGVDKEVSSATTNAISQFEKLGAKIEELSLDMVDYSVASYYTITATEAGSNLARYDNIRYGFDFDLEGYEFNSYISKVRKNFGPEVTRRMILGGFVPSAGHAGKYFLKALKVKNKLALFLIDFNTVTANLTGKPAISVPFELSNGLPIGIQILGKEMQDKLVLQAARALEKTTNLPKVPV
jgi:aspartyl-tRNA(Asn)/glutamyl-tRNA(Gln) amidotransferase subunit A